MHAAIISDIHGNLEALHAVLHAIDHAGIRRIFCLGDLVGYGPDSIECVRKSSEWELVIAGDWDLAVLCPDPAQWCPPLYAHMAWVREQFASDVDAERLLGILASYEQGLVDVGVHLCHGTPLDVRDWIFPEDIYCPHKLHRLADSFGHCCIAGHSHLPGVFHCRDGIHWHFETPVAERRFQINKAHKTIFTAGSVGQPRDEDPRASYLTIEDDVIVFHRVEYNVAATIRKIQANLELDNMYGERLLVGC